MRFITIVNFIFKITYLIFVFLFIKEKSDFIYVPLLQSLGLIFGGIYSLYIIKSKYNIGLKIVNYSIIKNQLKKSFSAFITLIVPTLYSNTSVFLLGIFTNNTFVGYLSGALRINNAFTSFNVVLTRTFYPYVNKKVSGRKKVNNFILICGLAFSIIMLLTSQYTVAILLGKEMETAIPLVRILSITPFLMAVRTVYGINTLLVKGFDNLYMRIAVFSSVLGLILAFILIPSLTYFGAALIVVISQAIYAFLSFHHSKKIS
jgi:PST family polysaccharide transporter